jgi:hypothetical protein
MGKNTARQKEMALGVAVALGVATVYIARRLQHRRHLDDTPSDFDALEQGITVKATLEAAEAAWIDWCAAGRGRLTDNYAVRFEPAPGARGTEVYVAGGGPKSTIREELRRFKQLIETGEIPLSDGPGLWRPAQPPRHPEEIRTVTGARR